ncbi:hypothetical protein LXA43DRAFT_1083961 [Ganoderma leucocontextum]|nr:hypothetical protein LXA43DRAFT_1083961 [Ganoderma leucocontextum]
MAAARLNVDVLAIVSEFLTDASDVLAFGLICSSLRPVAIRRLLSMRPISLTDHASLCKFHTFLFVDAPVRAPHIRALHIKNQNPKRLPKVANQAPGFSSLLIDIITLCPQLEYVSLFLDEEDDCTDDAPIIDAIAALKSLRSLSVRGSATSSLDLLHKVRSPLRMLTIDLTFPAALKEFLPRFAPTLQELKLASFRVQGDKIWAVLNLPAPPQSCSIPQYPSVRSLSVGCFTGNPLLHPLEYLFPALDGTLSLGQLDTRVPAYDYDHLRAANQRAQDQCSPSLAHAWKKLDRLVCGDAEMLYVLGLRCPIRLLMLDQCAAHSICYAADALRENPVPRLKLTLRYRRGVFDDPALFSSQLAGTLTHLTLCVAYDNDFRSYRSGICGDADDFAHLLWDDLLARISRTSRCPVPDNILSSLQPLHNLTHLRLVVHSKIYSTVKGPSQWHPAHSGEFVSAVRGSAFDFKGAAASLVRTLPSVRYVFLTTGGNLAKRDGSRRGPFVSYERWDVARAWRVAAGSKPEHDGTTVQDGLKATRTLVELDDGVAETIVRNEELVLSETDEYMFKNGAELSHDILHVPIG